MKVLQAAPVESIENISSFPRPLKPRVHLIRVLQLKEEVWHGCRHPFIFCQAAEFGVLVKIGETRLSKEESCASLWFISLCL